MAAMTPSSSLHNEFSRNLVSEQERDIFPRLLCHNKGIPWGNPQKKMQFQPILSRNVHSNNQN